MVRKSLLTAWMAVLLICLPGNCWARGFGGGGFGGGAGHAPGGFGGGFGGGMSRGPGGFGGGGPGAGMNRGPGEFGGEGIAGEAGRGPGGSGAGGFGGENFGAGRDAGEFHGFGAPGGFGQPGREGAGQFGAPGAGGNRFASPDRGQLNNFLGMPSDEGFRTPGSLGVGPGNFGVGTAAGVGGGRAGVGLGGVGRVGSGVGAAGGVGAFSPMTPAARYTSAAAVRGNYDHWGMYGQDWYGRYPGAWAATGWAAGAAWNACAWQNAAQYCGYANAQPMYYDYGNNVTYQDNSVYVNGQPAGTSQQYYEQASTIASAGGATADAPADGDWLPLGVFALSKSDATKSDVTIQLAINKQGIIRGNSTDTVTNTNKVIQGSVDKQTQKVAFTVGDNSKEVVETGLYNLTKDEAPCLIHFDQDRTEQWLLVRLQKPSAAAPSQN
jgi:hypothetical protein